jgi:hypothetical protein
MVGLVRDTDYQQMDRKQGSELINNSVRYLDHIIDYLAGYENVTGYKPQQQYSAANGPTALDAGKFLGQRSSGTTSNVEMVMNVMGLPTWRLNSYSMSPEADNRYNKLFNSMVEERARELWESQKFQDRPLEVKRSMWNEVLAKTRQDVLKYMERNVRNTGDAVHKALLDLNTTYGQKKFDQAIEELGLQDLDRNDLTLFQIRAIEDWLKTRDTYLRQLD